jgi:hypothetical protein
MSLFEVLVDDTRVGRVVETAEEAKDYVNYMRHLHPTAKVRMRKLMPEQAMIDAGHLRERRRMEDGTYTLLPDWFPTHANMYVHLADDERRRSAGYIAYSPGDDFLAEDRQLALPANTYLARHHSDTLTSDQISEVYQRFLAWLNAFTYEITGDDAAIYAAYTARGMRNESSGSISCMAGAFGGPQTHPARVYGGDASLWLAVAYDKCGTPVARALVCRYNKVYVRVYSVAEAARAGLERWLNERGYYREDGFYDSTIRAILMPGCTSTYLMPYIDGDSQGVTLSGKLWRISGDGDYEASGTGGELETCDEDEDDYEDEYEDDDTFECSCCGDRTPDDEATTVRVDSYNHTETWCLRCERNNTFECERTGYTYADHAGSQTVVTMNGEQTWSDYAVDRHAFFCEYTQRYYSDDDFTQVNISPPADEARLGDYEEVWCYEHAPVDGQFDRPILGAWSGRPNAQRIEDERQLVLCPMSDE